MKDTIQSHNQETIQIRFSLRTALLGVALMAFVGAGIRWAVTMQHRSRTHQKEAMFHDLSRQNAALIAESDIYDKDKRKASRKAEAWHTKQRDLFIEAASRPWRTVPPAVEPKFD